MWDARAAVDQPRRPARRLAGSYEPVRRAVAVRVASQLGDGGRDPGLLQPVEADQLGDVARALAGDDDALVVAEVDRGRSSSPIRCPPAGGRRRR